MASLANKHKSFIVIRLACYDSSTEIQQEFEELYGFKPDMNQIAYYNPDNILSSQRLAQKWRDLFNDTRARFKEEVQNIPIANQAYRLKKLQKNMEHLERVRNYKAANETIEQAAKEVGGSYTNKREHSGTLGSIDMTQLTEQQLQRIANGEHPIAVLANESESAAGDQA